MSDNELVFAGEVFDLSDPDDTILAYAKLKEWQTHIYQEMTRCKMAMVGMTDGEAKTRRVVGKACQAKLTLPSSEFDQRTLKELWNASRLAGKYIRISKLDVNRREVDELRNAFGDEELEAFKEKLLTAESESTRLPTVTIEQLPEYERTEG